MGGVGENAGTQDPLLDLKFLIFSVFDDQTFTPLLSIALDIPTTHDFRISLACANVHVHIHNVRNFPKVSSTAK